MLNLSHQDLLVQWIRSVFHLNVENVCYLYPIIGDASSREYFRVTIHAQTWVIMVAKPDRAFHQFIKIQELFFDLKLPVPKIKAVQYQQGWMILEDCGNQTLEQVISSQQQELQDHSYRQAMDALVILQAQPRHELPELEAHLLLEQIELFWTWFCQRHIQSEWDTTYRIELQPVFEHLVREISAYPKCIVHLDYHCRNLMVQPDTHQLGILDFQDAVWGPVLYDMVSLLEDAYWVCPAAEKKRYFEYYRSQIQTQSTFSNWNMSDWQRCFSLIAMQRHLKNLGIFARLHYRDHKSNYLQYLPRLIRYLIHHADSQPDFHSVGGVFKTHWAPLLAKQMGTESACMIEQ